MTSTKKIALSILGGLVVLLCVVVIAGRIWWGKHGAAMVEASRQAMEEGRSFGRGIPASRCVDEALARHARAPLGFDTTVQQSLFLNGCLKTASDLPALCAQNPDPGVMGNAKWLAAQCAAHSLTDRYCTTVLQPLVQACRRTGRA